jgi:hypothetical protein
MVQLYNLLNKWIFVRLKMTDSIQYCPLSSLQILQYFEEVKNRIQTLESDFLDIVELNNLTTERPKPTRNAKMEKKKTAPKHDDVEEDKKLINKGLEKLSKSVAPEKTPVKIKKGGRVAPNKR